MEEEDRPVNETFGILAEFAETNETQELVDQIESLTEDHENGSILSALVDVLVRSHLGMHVEDGGICVSCTNESLTELLQSIRAVHDNAMNEVEDGDE